MPRLTDICIFPVNSIRNASDVTVGDTTIFDTKWNRKNSKGFGYLYGNACISAINHNMVLDSDVSDQAVGPSNNYIPNIASPGFHY